MGNKDKLDADVKQNADAWHALRQQAEAIVQKKIERSKENLNAVSKETIQKMLHELRVHQIELEMQNEELRQTQLTLENSRALFFDLYDLAPVGYFTLSETGLILRSNLRASNLLGGIRGTLVGQPISTFILNADQDIFYLHRKQLLLNNAPSSCELRMLKGDGSSIWIHLTTTIKRHETGSAEMHFAMTEMAQRM